MALDLLVHTEDPARERRSADRRSRDRRSRPRGAGEERRGRERRLRWTAAPAEVRAPAAIPEGRPLPGVNRRERRYRRALIAADALAASLALLAAALLEGLELSPVHALVPLATLLALEAGDLYDRDDLVLRRSTLDEAPMLLLFASLATILAVAIGGEALAPGVLVTMWLTLGAALVLGRFLARAAIRATVPLERCLVVGDAERAAHVRRKIHDSRARAEVVATLPLAPGQSAEAFHGHLGLLALVLEHDIDRVILAPTSTDNAQTLELIRVAKAVGARVSLLPRMFEVVGSTVDFEDVDGVTMLGLRRFGLSAPARILKRGFDVAVAAAGLLALAPVIAAIAAAVRLDSPGPIFFRQVRVGRHGRRFHMLKFRSMVADAEQHKAALADRNETDGFFKITDDPRITRVGRILRKTSLDELPQFFNVLAGHMSIVGPRPLVTDEDERIVGLDRSRLHLTPGMTGPWQVLGSSRIPMSEMISLDYLYVTNWSLWLDIKLLLRTLPHVLARRGR
jgi:exopolysaccharide biosynthesis polyprenyl glycosylphosphotransferase